MSGNVVMFVSSSSELSNKLTNSTDAGDYMLGPIREENKIVDRLLYVDPYEAVSQTVAYMMMHSKAEDHFNKEYLPTAALYFPLKHMLGHTFALDNNENERTFGEKVKRIFKEVFGDSFNVSLSYFDKPYGMKPSPYMNYAHMLLERILMTLKQSMVSAPNTLLSQTLTVST